MTYQNFFHVGSSVFATLISKGGGPSFSLFFLFFFVFIFKKGKKEKVLKIVFSKFSHANYFIPEDIVSLLSYVSSDFNSLILTSFDI